MIARVDNASDAVRQETIAARGKTVKFLLRHFVSRALELYTPRISTIKMHEIVHIVDDYVRFGPLDNFSAFRFESFLSKLKTMVHAHRYPAMQVVNNYSALLHAGKFAEQGN